MTKKLNQIIEKVRYELSKNPSLITAGKINNGIYKDGKDLPIKPYREFLDVCDGARCGIVDLWSNENIKKNQYRVMNIDGGNEKWVCIGQILYEPLVFNLQDEKIYLFYQGYENEIKEKCFGNFDDFLLNYVFGEKYKELIFDMVNDEWYMFLTDIDLV